MHVQGRWPEVAQNPSDRERISEATHGARPREVTYRQTPNVASFQIDLDGAVIAVDCETDDLEAAPAEALCQSRAQNLATAN
jgi:hypothetical protein